MDGTAIRVPTPNVSLIDLTLVTEKEVMPESINEAMSKAANKELKGILSINQKPLVSKILIIIHIVQYLIPKPNKR